MRTKTILFVLFMLTINTMYAVVNPHMEWVKTIGNGTGVSQVNATATDSAGNIFIAAQLVPLGLSHPMSIDLDPGPDSVILTTQNGNIYYLLKLNPDGTFIWGKELKGLNNSGLIKVTIDKEQNLYLTGKYTNYFEFDPGAGNPQSPTSNGTFLILKVSNNGQFIWQKALPAEIKASATDKDMNLCLAGTFQPFSKTDFDPSDSAKFILTNDSVSSGNIFISKLNRNGDFLWAKHMGNSNSDVIDIKTDKDGNIYAAGLFKKATDFNPEPGVFMLTPVDDSFQNIFFYKCDADGHFVWAKNIGGNGTTNAVNMDVDYAGNTYLYGTFANTVDFDPGSAKSEMECLGKSNIFILKLNKNGGYEWAKHLKSFYNATYINTNIDHQACLISDNKSSIYFASAIVGKIDVDPGPAIIEFNGGGNSATLIERMDTSGNFIWARQINRSESYAAQWNFAAGLSVYDNNIYTIGTFHSSNDFNPGAGTYKLSSKGFADMYILNMDENDCPDLAIIYDSTANANCTSSPLGYISARVINGTAPYTWDVAPDTTATITLTPTTGGIYNMLVEDKNACITTSAVIIDGPTILNGFDLETNITVRNGGWQEAFDCLITVEGFNNSCTETNARQMLVLPSGVQYVTATPQPSTVDGDTLIWNIGSITFDSAHFIARVGINTELGINNTYTAIIEPKNADILPGNNIKMADFISLGNPFDPNAKSVFPGKCDEGFVLPKVPLTYTIEFQNTGTASAKDVYILDTLSEDLDVKKIKVQGSSHTVITEIISGSVLKFRFNNIYLPDSNANEKESHGYVIYRIDQKDSLRDGIIIRNSSSIYFDTNEPIKTNTVRNTIASVLPDCKTATGIQSATINFSLFPNPTTSQMLLQCHEQVRQVIISDLSGKEVYRLYALGSGNSHIIPVSFLQNGMYLMQVSTISGTGTQKFVIHK